MTGHCRRTVQNIFTSQAMTTKEKSLSVLSVNAKALGKCTTLGKATPSSKRTTFAEKRLNACEDERFLDSQHAYLDSVIRGTTAALLGLTCYPSVASMPQRSLMQTLRGYRAFWRPYVHFASSKYRLTIFLKSVPRKVMSLSCFLCANPSVCPIFQPFQMATMPAVWVYYSSVSAQPICQRQNRSPNQALRRADQLE